MLTKQGHTILNFGPGQPDFPTPQHVKDAGCDAIQGNQTTYTNPSGTSDIKAEIAKFMNRTRKLEGDNAVSVRRATHAAPARCCCSWPSLSLTGPAPSDEAARARALPLLLQPPSTADLPPRTLGRRTDRATTS
jgi:hypothetical protein